jgi:hypothetical protein
MEKSSDVFESNPPFWGTFNQLDQFVDLVKNCVDIIKKSSNAREMVLETWLTLDYSIRILLLNGFELDRFCDNGFDLTYRLLPRGFNDLLKLLKDTVDFQSKLDRTPDAMDNIVKWGSMEFWVYVSNNYKNIWEQLGEIEMEYYKNKRPELYELKVKEAKLGVVSFQIPPKKVQRMPEDWLEVVGNLKTNWYKSAESLNRARNKAAHSYDVEQVGAAFGITGENLTNQVRRKCLELLRVLLKVSIPTSE